MANEMLDILIGRHIDSEITPAEQRLLDEMLRSDEQAQRLVVELERLRDLSRQSLRGELDKITLTADAAFEQAWRQAQRPRQRLRRQLGPLLRIAAVLALGFMIGLASRYDYRPSAQRSAAPREAITHNGGRQASPAETPAMAAAAASESLPVAPDDFPIVRDGSGNLENSMVVRRWIAPQGGTAPRRYVEWRGYPVAPRRMPQDVQTVDYHDR